MVILTGPGLERFAEAVRELPEVVELYRMSDQVDYLLRVLVPDIEAYDRFYKKLIAKIELLRRQLQLRHGADQAHHRPAARLCLIRVGSGLRHVASVTAA